MTRKALLVGLNRYPDPENTLRGCVNDVQQTARMLQDHYGFKPAGMRLLTDQRATTRAIKRDLAWLVDGAVANDLRVFHYSGHGSQVPDRSGDEVDDGLDEIICPYDLDWNRPFTDDDLREIVGGLAPGVNLTVILDCCHAGTGLRRPADGSWRLRCLAPPVGLRRFHREGRPVRRFGQGASERGAILIAACAADQVSADAWIDNEYHGALTYFLWRAAGDAGFEVSYLQLLRNVRHLVAEAGYDQVPQLEGEKAFLGQTAFSPFALTSV